MQYNLELDKIAKEIKKSNAKLVAIQLPDGLKPQATLIANFIEKNTKAKPLILFHSCFGACDIPNLPKNIDLLIHFGHSNHDYKLIKHQKLENVRL